jgi:hypothetical protein
MRTLARGAALLLVGAALLSLPRDAFAHDTGYPHRHVYAAGAPALNLDRTGVYLGAGLVGNIVVSQIDSPGGNDFISHGGGGQLFLGVRLHRYFALEFGYAQTAHNPVEDPSGYTVSFLALHALTADAKFIFPNRSNVRPYVQVGVGYYILTHEYEDATSGGGIQLGVGIDIWLNPWWTLGGRVLYHGIKFDELGSGSVQGRPFLSTASLDLNVQVHF